MTTAADLPAPALTSEREHARAGFFFGIGAYSFWGFIPLYIALLHNVPAKLFLAHRVVWSLVWCAVAVTITRGWPLAVAAVKHRRTLLVLAGSTVLIAINWYVYIYAVLTNRVSDASLGYYLNPLVNVLLGVALLGERLRPGQLLAMAIAAIGVVAQAMLGVGFPWLAVTIAVSFSLYGLLRKIAQVGPLIGLTIETAVLLPLALTMVLLHAGGRWESAATLTLRDLTLLVLAGGVTAVPLLLFAAAARRLRFSTLGFLQYLAPSLQLLCAVYFLHETRTRAQWLSFGVIWIALVVYSVDSIRAHRRAVALAE